MQIIRCIGALAFYGLIGISVGQSSFPIIYTAMPGQIPYHVGLNILSTQGLVWCSGSLITNQWIVSAAHCFDNLGDGALAYLGIVNRTAASEPGRKEHFISNKAIIIHQKYIRGHIRNDIALLRLTHPVKFSETIKSINLPQENTTLSGTINVMASGWRPNDEIVFHRDVLKYTVVPILDLKSCKNSWKKYVSDSNVCIDPWKGATCFGNSGDPIVVFGQHLLWGLSSFDEQNCNRGMPRVYTRIASYLDWIHKTIRSFDKMIQMCKL